MRVQWTLEAVIAVVGLGGTAAGTVFMEASHWGALTTKVAQQEQHLDHTDTELQALREKQQQTAVSAATVDQKLDDMLERLDRIEKDVRP